MKHNVLKRIAQIFLTLSGVIAVFYVSPLLAVPLRMQFHWSAQSILLLQIVLAAVVALFCWLIAVPVLNKIVALTKWIEGKLQKMSTQDLVSGAIGLIIGLIVAFFIGYALSFRRLSGRICRLLCVLFLDIWELVWVLENGKIWLRLFPD